MQAESPGGRNRLAHIVAATKRPCTLLLTSAFMHVVANVVAMLQASPGSTVATVEMLGQTLQTATPATPAPSFCSTLAPATARSPTSEPSRLERRVAEVAGKRRWALEVSMRVWGSCSWCYVAQACVSAAGVDVLALTCPHTHLNTFRHTRLPAGRRLGRYVIVKPKTVLCGCCSLFVLTTLTCQGRRI